MSRNIRVTSVFVLLIISLIIGCSKSSDLLQAETIAKDFVIEPLENRKSALIEAGETEAANSFDKLIKSVKIVKSAYCFDPEAVEGYSNIYWVKLKYDGHIDFIKLNGDVMNVTLVVRDPRMGTFNEKEVWDYCKNSAP